MLSTRKEMKRKWREKEKISKKTMENRTTRMEKLRIRARVRSRVSMRTTMRRMMMSKEDKATSTTGLRCSRRIIRRC